MVDRSWPSPGMSSKSSSARSHAPPLEHALIVALYTMVLVSTPCSRMASKISTHFSHAPLLRHRVENMVNARGSLRMGASLSLSASRITAATPPAGAFRRPAPPRTRDPRGPCPGSAYATSSRLSLASSSRRAPGSPAGRRACVGARRSLRRKRRRRKQRTFGAELPLRGNSNGHPTSASPFSLNPERREVSYQHPDLGRPARCCGRCWSSPSRSARRTRPGLGGAPTPAPTSPIVLGLCDCAFEAYGGCVLGDSTLVRAGRE